MCTNEGEMCMIKESEKRPVFTAGDTLIIPKIVYDFQNQDEIRAITYTVNGIKYQLSNEEGHKVYASGSYSAPRPMTKKEFKDLYKYALNNEGMGIMCWAYTEDTSDTVINAIYEAKNKLPLFI